MADVSKKMRLDLYLVKSGMLKSRMLAKEYIGKGSVTLNGKIVKKPAVDVSEEDVVSLISPLPKYVGRGGVKLEAAIRYFSIDVCGKVCCDIGASTGGFSDCLLQSGASRVYAVDSGTGQIDPTLSSDPRVVSIENFNARNLSVGTIGEFCDIITVDVSFISQCLIIPAAQSVLKKGGIYIGLIKPQFECGREGLGKGGIVKKQSVCDKAIERVLNCTEENGISVTGVMKSPLTGGDGNTEYLMCGLKR